MEEEKNKKELEDEDSEGEPPHSLIQVGDISIQSKNLKVCREELGELLKNPDIKKYLGLCKEQSIFKNGASYID